MSDNFSAPRDDTARASCGNGPKAISYHLKKYPNFNGVVIDPSSLGEPEIDTSIRPDGKKVTVKARGEASGAGGSLAPYQTLTFTEFIDPTGIVTYVHLLDLSKTEEDELISDCFLK